MDEHGLRAVVRKTGAEAFQTNGAPMEVRLLDFWQWTGSNLLSNTLRGHLAEFLVASALGIATDTRIEWDATDLISPNGIRIEVKSAAYVQAWKAKPSSIKFAISEKLSWNWQTSNYHSNTPGRMADVYVFCLLYHSDPESIDPLNLDQWCFFILATQELATALGQQKTISLGRLRSLPSVQAVDYTAIATAIEQVTHRTL